MRHIQPASKSDGAPEVQQMTPEPAAEFKLGSPVMRDAGDPSLIIEHDAGAVGIVGFAMASVVAGLPDPMGDKPFGTTVPIAKARADVGFFASVGSIAAGVNTPQTVLGDGSLIGPAALNKITATGIWVVDVAGAGIQVVVYDELPELNGVLFKVQPAAIAN